MNRRTFAATSAALLLIATGALAARLAGLITPHSSSGGFNDSAGRVWNYTSSFKGTLTLFDPQGKRLGEFRTDLGDPLIGDIDLSVAGRHYDLRGVGRHDIKDAQGALIGYAVLGPLSARDIAEMQKEAQDRMPHDFDAAAAWERRQQIASGGGSGPGVTSFPVYVAGFGGGKNVFWIMRGQGTVHVTPPAGNLITVQGSTMTMTPALRQSLPPEFRFSDEELKTPLFIFSVGGKITHEQGYGKHVIRNAVGKPLLILKATPSLLPNTPVQ